MFSRWRRVAGDRADQADELQYRSHSQPSVPADRPLLLARRLTPQGREVLGFKLGRSEERAKPHAQAMTPPDVPADDAMTRNPPLQVQPMWVLHGGH